MDKRVITPDSHVGELGVLFPQSLGKLVLHGFEKISDLQEAPRGEILHLIEKGIIAKINVALKENGLKQVGKLYERGNWTPPAPREIAETVTRDTPIQGLLFEHSSSGNKESTLIGHLLRIGITSVGDIIENYSAEDFKHLVTAGFISNQSYEATIKTLRQSNIVLSKGSFFEEKYGREPGSLLDNFAKPTKRVRMKPIELKMKADPERYQKLAEFVTVMQRTLERVNKPVGEIIKTDKEL